MNVNDLFPSKYLKKEDVPHPTAVMIRAVTQEEVKGERGNELKACLHFSGNLKPMILNKGNAMALAEAYGGDTSTWIGKTVEVYNDPSVMFAGKRVGGVRVRVPGPGAAPAPAAPAPSLNGHGELWDITDGANKLERQTADQVRSIIKQSGAPAARFWIKPAGADRTQAKTGDKWEFVNGQTCEPDDLIPF